MSYSLGTPILGRPAPMISNYGDVHLIVFLTKGQERKLADIE